MKPVCFYFTAEVITVDTARNFLSHMQSMGITDSYSSKETSGRRMIYLTEAYATTHKMDDLLGSVLKFVTY